MSRCVVMARPTPGRALSRIGALGVIALGLAGCGQKGPLYLPDKNGSVITRPGSPNASQTPPTQTSPAAAPKKKDDDASTSK